jgi:hypothetical protein
VLNGRGVELVGQGGRAWPHGGAIVRKDADLDQAMRLEGCVGFFFDRIGQAVTADHDDRVQVMGIGAQWFALGRGKLYLGHRRIIGDAKTFGMS